MAQRSQGNIPPRERQRVNKYFCEITDPRAYKGKICSPVFPSDEIFQRWKSVYEAVRKSLDDNDKRELMALECFRYGRNNNPAENLPTVLISVRKNSRKSWRSFRERVVKIPDDLRLFSVAVCIIENEITRWGERKGRLPDNGCQKMEQARLSLGLEQESTGSGTLGGFIEIKSPNTKQWRNMGLTSFHCVYEGRTGSTKEEKMCLDRWQWQNVAANSSDAAKILTVCQPSWGDLRSQIGIIQKKIDDFETPEFLQMEQDIANGKFIVPYELGKHQAHKTIVNQKKELKAHFEDFLKSGKPHLGHVFAGSGIYAAKRNAVASPNELPSTRDWAVIEVTPARMGDNTVKTPPSSHVEY